MGRRKAQRAGSPPPFASCPRALPRSCASSCSSRVPARSPRRGDGSPRPMPTCSPAFALVPEDATGLTVQLTTTCASVERLLGRHDEAHARLRASL